jgi:3-deoxy-7-phosphoheptulonate synthase
MLLKLRKNLAPADRDALFGLCRELGLEPRTLTGVSGGVELVDLIPTDKAGVDPARTLSLLNDQFAVASIVDAGPASERFARANGQPDTIVRVGEAIFGGGHVSLVAGPCSVDEEDVLLDVARRVKAAGATLLRGGVHKPRTSPYSFQGLGDDGLALLGRVREEVGIAVVTEVLEPGDIAKTREVCDMLQIGSRNMINTPLLREVAKAGMPVLLKRGMTATSKEFLLAAEYLLSGGCKEVVLCERGIRGFDSATRNVLDLGTVAHLKQATHLPVIVDPSHAAGRADLIRPLARAGVAVGCDGLIVEVHPYPMRAKSDAEQAISPDLFAEIAGDALTMCRALGKTLIAPSADSVATPEAAAPLNYIS